MAVFSWCGPENRHSECKRTLQKFMINPKSNKLIWLDEWFSCECKKRGCACFVPAKNRTKPTKRKSK